MANCKLCYCIRSIKENIKNFENEKVKLNEKLIFPKKSSILKSSKDDLKMKLKFR